ncbi:MAG TPA: diguanylate cyclase [Syntrophomonas sp.]|nr:diguanylate cyclase [Syntrophomonas sp.]
MMKFIKDFFAPSPRLSKTEQKIFANEQYYRSLTSLCVFAVLMVSAGIVLLFLWNFPNHGAHYFEGHPGELYRNYLYAILLAVQPFYILNYFITVRRSPDYVSRLNKVIVIGEAFFFLCWSAALSSVDQLIHGDITVYLIGCFTIAAVVKLLPYQFLICYAFSLLVFLLGISKFQTDPTRLSAHYVNGSVLVLLALITSLLMYRAVLRAFAYHLTIQQQKAEMEARVCERTADLALANEELKEEIAERKAAEEKMRYISMHDTLTGLYNRTLFEKEMHRLDEEQVGNMGLIMCDVDGLKLINDSMGHDKGDSLLINTANLIKSCFNSSDIVARVGGDEFAVLVPNASQKKLEDCYRRMQKKALHQNQSLNELPLSLSIGFALRTDGKTSLNKLYIEADDNMYREKLYRSKSVRSAIVQTLMKALEARDFITEGHAERLQVMVGDMGESIGFSPKAILDLRLFAQFHDIGKVGLPDRILFKHGPLTTDEKLEMQRHCEIGHRIALASPDLMHISDWVLKHHEWWNGNGYPLGLKGEEIPLECRILAIADAYDAMTSDRPYRKAMPHEDAIEELKRCAGTQFDPELVEQFTIFYIDRAMINRACSTAYSCVPNSTIYFRKGTETTQQFMNLPSSITL